MNTQRTTPTRVLTAREARWLGRAAAILARIDSRASGAAWDAPMSTRYGDPTPQGYGRLAEAADMAGSLLFNVVNVANAHLDDAYAINIFREAQQVEASRGES